MTAAHGLAGRPHLADWLFGLLLLIIGIANLVLVHPVPAIGYVIASLVYLPPARAMLINRFGLMAHPVVRIGLGVVIVMFTLGVSDLGEILDGPGG